VVDCVGFLSQREERAAAAQRLTKGLVRLDGLKLPKVSEDEIEADIRARRRNRQGRRSG
jgi:hypothetical protein